METFISKINSYLLTTATKEVVVIEACEIRDEKRKEILYNILLLGKNKSNITVKKHQAQINQTELAAWISSSAPKDAAVLLMINSDSILNRTVTTGNIDDALKQALPSTPADDFVGNMYTFNDNNSFLSIARKSYVSYILSTIGDIQNRIVKVILGPYPVFYIKDLAFSNNQGNQIVKFQNYSFSFLNNELTDFRISPYKSGSFNPDPDISVGAQTIDTKLLLPFSTGVAYLLHPFTLPALSIPEVDATFEAHNFKNTAKAITYVSSAVIFAILLISSVLFTIYHGKQQQLSADYKMAQNKWAELKTIKQKQDKQKEILLNTGIGQASNIAYYTDLIASSLPEDMYIRLMEIHPVNTRSIEEHTTFLNNEILIEGNCYTGTELHNWISTLKQNDWIKDISINEFKHPDENEIGSFKIKILKKEL